MKFNNQKFIWVLISTSIITFGSCASLKNIQISKDKIQLVNRQLMTEITSDHQVVSLSAQPGSGIAIINDVKFIHGTIDVDLLGENNPGQSFVGMAFNIQNDSTYEAVYFRPFNFHSPEKIRREHCMQYISHPEFGWRKLRTEREGQFEAEYTSPPSPDDWFAVTLQVNAKTVIVNEKSTGRILMEAERLTTTKSDQIGFWVGHNSKGSFKNLKVRK